MTDSTASVGPSGASPAAPAFRSQAPQDRPSPRARIWLGSFGLAALVGVITGLASALFLVALDVATDFRVGHEVIVYALPLAGLAIGCCYQRFGQSAKGGTNLVIDATIDNEAPIPTRLAPMVLLGTVFTHLFGGSAGREGTAVQMGGSLADWVARRWQLSGEARRQLIAAGVAGGFGSVFGTPIAGTIFALELATVGRLDVRRLPPALIAATVGDLTTRGLGVGHTHYPFALPLALTPLVIGKWLLFAAAMAAASIAFVSLVAIIKRFCERELPWLPLRLALGGLAVVIGWRLLGTSDYLGLGIPTIVRAFSDPELPIFAAAWKLLFTAVTVATGFIGGEVTPLFFIGATLGNVMARLLELPIELGAAVGMAAIFAACANAPLALSVMAVELCGASVLPHVMIVATAAYLMTGRRSLYSSQRQVDDKWAFFSSSGRG